MTIPTPTSPSWLAARRSHRSRPLAGTALSARVAAAAIGIVVAVSFAARWLASLGLRTPFLMPDEYIYSSLAHSIAETGRATVRGTSSHFPALLEPVLTAPLWLGGDVGLSYRLTQGLNALAMSLAAVLVYLLARWLDVGRGTALALAAFAVAIPDLLLSGYLLAEGVAYPLVLLAVLLGVRALERPTAARQLLFVVAAAAASFARVQFVALFVAFFLAAVVSERRHVLQRYWPSLVPVVVPAIAYTALRGRGALGYYSGVLDFGLHPLSLARWTAIDAMLVAYAAGLVLVPGATVALFAAAFRPRSARQAAYARLLLFLALGLFAEAVLYATNGSGRFQERYLFCLLPLLAIAFPLFLERARALRVPALALALVLWIVSMRVPLGPYTVAAGAQDSPFLQAVTYTIRHLGQGEGGLTIALIAAPLLALSAFATLRPHPGGAIALAAAIAVAAAASYAATTSIVARTQMADYTYFRPDKRVIDHEAGGPVSLIVTPHSSRPLALGLMFWNRSLTRLVNLPGSADVDSFSRSLGYVDASGRLIAGGRPLTGPVVVLTWGARPQLVGGRTLEKHINWSLWRPASQVRFSSFTDGLYFDGWLSAVGWTTVWPDGSRGVDAVVRYRLTLPASVTRNEPMVFRTPGLRRRVVLRPGRTTTVEIPVHSQRGPVTIRFRSPPPLLIVQQGRILSAWAQVSVLRGR